MILFIDDDETSMEITLLLIRTAFVREKVLFFKQPEEAEQYISDSNQTKLIILDVMFAGISNESKGGHNRGIKWFKEKLENTNIPVIFYSNIESKKLELLLKNEQIDTAKYNFYNKLDKYGEQLIDIIEKVLENNN